MIKNFFTQTPSYYNDWLSRLAPLLSVSCFLEHRGPKVSSKVLLHHSILPSALALGSCCLWAISLSLTAHRLCHLSMHQVLPFPDHDNCIQELCLYKSQLIRYALSVLWKYGVHSLTVFSDARWNSQLAHAGLPLGRLESLCGKHKIHPKQRYLASWPFNRSCRVHSVLLPPQWKGPCWTSLSTCHLTEKCGQRAQRQTKGFLVLILRWAWEKIYFRESFIYT